MKCGIYKIENIKTGSIYIGQSIDLPSRLRDHISDLIKGRGVCAREAGAQPQDWTFSIIEQCEEIQLDKRERYWIARYDSFNNGLNHTTGGRANYSNKKEKEQTPSLDFSLMHESAYFTNIFEYIETLSINQYYFIFSPNIKENQQLAARANELGFRALELHSSNNKDYPLTEKQKKIIKELENSGTIKEDYNFIISTNCIDYELKDKRFDFLIFNSFKKEEREKTIYVSFPFKCALKTFAPEIPETYLNKWLNMEECRELANLMNISDFTTTAAKRIMTWNKLKDYLPNIGYTVEGKRKRIDGKLQQCYFITGTWKDAEIEDGNFLSLVEAKMAELV